MKKILLLFLVTAFINLGLAPNARAADIAIREYAEKYFGGFTGTFVMCAAAENQYTIYNEPQSAKRLSPCSTFKIYNSLIGLETGVLDGGDANTLFKWRGAQHSIPSWNRDHTLASATRDSVVWYYQEVASKIGQERMQDYIDKLGYGNKDISGGLTNFWLRSSLKISAREQVELLNKLYTGQLPFSPKNVAIVKNNITLLEENGTLLMGKTGSALENGKLTIGWFVGCVEKQGKRYIFAVNIEADDGAHGGKAREIALNILRALGVLSSDIPF